MAVKAPSKRRGAERGSGPRQGRNKKRAPKGPSVREISDMLAAHAESVCREFIPAGTVSGNRFTCASGFLAKGTQVSVVLTGDRAGKWKDFTQLDVGGDLVDLIEATQGLDKAAAIREAKAWLGISEETGRQCRTKRRVDGRIPGKSDKAAKAERKQAEKRVEALNIWHGSRPAKGTLAEAYLRCRGLIFDGITTPPFPENLRFHPLLRRWMPRDTEEIPRVYPSLPALVAPVVSPGGGLMTVHVTWLGVEGTEIVTVTKAERFGACARGVSKADLFKPKLVHGSYRGGFIPLTRAGQTLALAEGIETALSVLLVRPGWSVWSAVSVSNMGNIRIPPQVERLVLLGDGDSSAVRDPDGSVRIPADQALMEAARLQAAVAADEGRRLDVEIRLCPGKQDFNDLLRAEGARAVAAALTLEV